MGAGFYGEFGNTKGSNDAKTKLLIDELEKNGVKISKGNVVFATKDKTGQTVWLEKGNKKAGLEHILEGNGISPGHAADFEKAFGITKDQLPSFLNNIISNGEIVSNQLRIINGRCGFERIYFFDGKYFVLTGIGTNGFIVTAYPVEYGG